MTDDARSPGRSTIDESTTNESTTHEPTGSALAPRAILANERPSSTFLARLAPLDGAPLVRHVVQAALGSQARPVVVVTGHLRDRVMEALDGLRFVAAHNPVYASGLASSLKAGFAALAHEKTDGVLVLLADMPGVSATLLDRLVAAFARDPSVDAVIPVHEGRRGNPVLLGRALFPSLPQLAGDAGARKILAAASRVVEVPVSDDAVTLDIDTPDALAALKQR